MHLPAASRRRNFLKESGETPSFAAGQRLTGEMSDVGTERPLHRSLIRVSGAARSGRLQGAVIADQSNVRTIARRFKGSTRMGFSRQQAKTRIAAGAVAAALFFGLTG